MFAFSCVVFFVAIDIGMTNRLAVCSNFHLTALFSSRFQCRQYVIFSFHFSLFTFHFSEIRCKGTKNFRTMQYIVVKNAKNLHFYVISCIFEQINCKNMPDTYIFRIRQELFLSAKWEKNRFIGTNYPIVACCVVCAIGTRVNNQDKKLCENVRE